MSIVIDVNKIDGLREYAIYHYWYFLEIHFKIQPKVRNNCHNLMRKGISVNDFTIFFY